MSKDGSGWANFFLGLGVGVGVGLLLAPQSGEATRDLLRAKADEGKDFLKKQAAELQKNAGGLKSDLADRGADLVERGKEAVTRQKDLLSDAIEAGRMAYRDKVQAEGAAPESGEPA